MIEAVADQVFIPLTVGGGVTHVDDIRALLNAGADKVSINTAGVKNPALIGEAASALRRAMHRRRDRRQAVRGRRAGRSTPMAAARRPGSTPSNGRAEVAGSAPAKSC